MTIIGIDIGNTTISVALIRDKSVSDVFILETRDTHGILTKKLNGIFQKISRGKKIQDAVICSVVPSVTQTVVSAAKKTFGTAPLIVGKDLNVPMPNRYDNPKRVGQDRLVGAYAAMKLYGTPALVIDLGTAITFDIVSKSGEYEGGMIVPGLRLSAESLFQKTALLPRIDRIKAPRSIVGKNTTESILSGIFYGYGAMCSGVIQMMTRRFKRRPHVVVTGGHADVMKRFIENQNPHIRPHLIFEGLRLVYRQK